MKTPSGIHDKKCQLFSDQHFQDFLAENNQQTIDTNQCSHG